MTTVGQQIMERLEALENTITELQLNQEAPIAPGARRDAEQFRNNLREEMATLRDQVRNFVANPTSNADLRVWGIEGIRG